MNAVRWRRKTKVELYNLSVDPFESTNLALPEHISKYSDKIREIRDWAKAEIGRPAPAVVGQWNDAYATMMKTAYKKMGYGHFLVDSRD